jgi:hypothetical protein
MHYKQVELSKKTSAGYKRYITYIPSKFATMGKFLKIDGDDGSVDTFQVTQVYHSISESQLQALSTSQRQFKYVLGDE